MLRQKTFLFFFLSATIIFWTITFSLFPLQSESGDVYSYTDENGAIVYMKMKNNRILLKTFTVDDQLGS